MTQMQIDRDVRYWPLKYDGGTAIDDMIFQISEQRLAEFWTKQGQYFFNYTQHLHF